MKLNISPIIPAIGLALFLANQGAVVQAGYLSAPLAVVRGVSSPLAEVLPAESQLDGSTTGSTSVNATEGNGRTSIEDVLKLDFLSSIRVANFSAAGGMSPPPTDSTGSTQVVALVAELLAGQAPLVVWLGAEGRSRLPPPTGTNIFHPPRLVG